MPPAPYTLQERLAVGFAASLALHFALLLSFEPGAELFARGRTPGKSTDNRLIALLTATEREVRTDMVPAIIDTENASGDSSKSDAAVVDTANPGRRNTAPDHGIAGSSGDQSAYFSDKEFDVRPVPVGEIVLDNPDLTGTVSGVVLLRLQINQEGRVDRVIVVRAVPDHSFRTGTFSAFERATFIPAIRHGIPVNSEILVEVRYGPEGEDSARPAANAARK